jgi:hypothetical protein
MSTPQWQHQLSLAIANTVGALRAQLADDALVMLAVDCHPWNGGVYLAALTQSEVDADPSLADPAEMAAWKYYDFGESCSNWNVDSLCDTMRNDYYSSDDHDTIAQGYLRSCAAALADEAVVLALRHLVLHDGFRVSVTHPDDGSEYCT